jgi:hypothetical protein
MIGQGDHIEQIGVDAAEIYSPAANDELPLAEPVLTVELLNELKIRRPTHGNEIGDPGVHSVPRFHNMWVIQVVPQRQVGTNIVLDRLECLSTLVDHLAWYDTVGVDDLLGIEVLIVHPAHKASSFLISEIQWCCKQEKIFETIIGS